MTDPCPSDRLGQRGPNGRGHHLEGCGDDRRWDPQAGRPDTVEPLRGVQHRGGPPLPELSGGKRLLDATLRDVLNQQFDKVNDGFPLVEYISATQIWVDKNQMKASHTSLDAIKRFVLGYRLDGAPFFDSAYTRDEIETIRLARRVKH